MIMVDPAYAGMILIISCEFIPGYCGPRVCGDDPMYKTKMAGRLMWTPRMRG